MPHKDGRITDSVGKWDSFQDEVSDWVVRKGLQAKLEGVILKNLLRDMFYDGSSGADQVDHEEQLYQPIASAIYEPVNQAAQILGLPLRYSFSYGEHAKTKADLRALHRETEQTYIPHEVKALWGEAHKGQHVVDLLRNVQTRDTVARPVAQILSYMVEEWSMYGVLSNKLNHTFIKSPADPNSRHVDVTDTFNSEIQLQPSVRLMYLYMLDLAGSAARLDPQERPATADIGKRAPPSRKRAHQSISEHGASADHHDADGTDDTTGDATDGPAQHTRSKASTTPPKAKQAAKSTGTMQPRHLQKQMAKCVKILSRIPHVPRNSLNLAEAMCLRKTCVVRHGTWQGIPAVYKVWDLGDSLQPLLDMQDELDAYHALRPLQGVHIPRLLGHGQIHEGLHAFIAMSAGGSPLSPAMLRSCPASAEHAMCALKAVHQQNMLHGDIALQNFVTSDTARSMWLVDLVEVWPGTAAETAREEQTLSCLLKCWSM